MKKRILTPLRSAKRDFEGFTQKVHPEGQAGDCHE